MNFLDNFFFIALPYVALVGFLIGTIVRYRMAKFSISSLSSQFMESGSLFWGSVSFHIGILILIFGHLIAFLFPSTLLAFNSVPVRLLIIEITGFAAGLLLLFGLLKLLYRRLTNDRVLMVTNKMDIFVELLILAQVILGILVAYNYQWGSSWFAAVLTPYLRSIFLFSPDIAAVSAMPWMMKWHVIGAYLIVLLFPFSRLMHILVTPLHYIWRPYQRVLWNWDPKKIRDPKTKWTQHRPKNT
ncbi:MAG: respiratory nitrate reductase subunit gamma [Candidatus Kapaibacterium sp.]